MLKRFVQILAVAGIAAGLVSGPVWACDKEAKAAQTAEAKCDKPCCDKKADAAVAQKAGCAKSAAGCSKTAKTTLEAKKSDKAPQKAAEKVKDEIVAKADDKAAGTN